LDAFDGKAVPSRDWIPPSRDQPNVNWNSIGATEVTEAFRERHLSSRGIRGFFTNQNQQAGAKLLQTQPPTVETKKALSTTVDNAFKSRVRISLESGNQTI
jgi:hypothetical protein